ncbi:MAG: RluA family pseudouridine synthase [Pirellulales bacterium]
MHDPRLEVLYEDNHLLALNKPAGLATMGVSADVPSLLSLARDYIKHHYNKPGNVYLGAMSRLDAPVTGVVLFARTSKAAARLTEQFRGRSVEKAYWAVVAGGLPKPAEECVDWIRKDERHRRMHLAGEGQAGAQLARLHYRRLRQVPGGWLLEVELATGRKHQIRLQLSARGFPVLGDRKYGSREAFASGLALHSRRLVFEHPTRGERIVLEAPLPASWQRFGLE